MSRTATAAIALFAAFGAAACGNLPPVPLATPYAETPPVGTGQGEDAADDPAVWIHPSDPAKSLVFGTDKKAGFYAYDLSGAQVQHNPAGELNNIDIRQGVQMGGQTVDLMGASNRTDNSLTLFTIDRATGLATLHSATPTGIVEPYGFCMGNDANGWIGVIPYKTGDIQLFRFGPDGKPVAAPATFKVSGQSEGCVVDEENGAIFVGEENVGLWRFTYDGVTETSRTLVDRINSGTGLVADVEGVALWRAPGGEGYVIVSSQSADRYMIYDRKAPNALRGAFGVGASPDGKVDAVSHTDGIEVISTPLGPGLPRGIFIAQDDDNSDPAAAQNFKFVDWREIEKAIGLN